MIASCRQCRFFTGEPAALEQAIPGLNILSSAFGSARADTGLCRRRDVLLVPAPACADFQSRAMRTGE